jgi:SAM-dependent methyltransferase
MSPDLYVDPMSWIDAVAGRRIARSAEECTFAIQHMLETRFPGRSLFLVVDEVSQYVHENKDRMGALQSFVAALLAAGCRVTGADFSDGMLRVARARAPGVPLLRADLQRGLPLGAGVYDAVLSALVGEHLTALETCFSEVRRVLVPGGRLLFTVYAPELAAAGKEANFEVEGIEYRLGAERHRREDYERAMAAAGFADLRSAAFDGDEALAREVPSARKFVGRPLLLIIEAR